MPIPQADKTPPSLGQRLFRLVGTIAVLLIFLISACLLKKRLEEFTLREILDALRQTGSGQLAAAVALTALSYVVLVGYDLLAVRAVKQNLSLGKIALASFAGYSFSYNFGATLFGSTIRYRLYAGWRMPALVILELLVILGLTFWFGLFFLAGILFLIDPVELPEKMIEDLAEKGVHLPITDTWLIGLILLIVALAYLALSAVLKGRIRVLGREIPVPPFRLTCYQYLVASADFIVAAAVLYVLLPPMEGIEFTDVMGVYILAYVAEVLTHVPGGWGVFEVPMLYLLPVGTPHQIHVQRLHIIAAVLLFRVIYRLVPLLIAAALFAMNEVVLRKESFHRLHKIHDQPESPAGAGPNES